MGTCERTSPGSASSLPWHGCAVAAGPWACSLVLHSHLLCTPSSNRRRRHEPRATAACLSPLLTAASPSLLAPTACACRPCAPASSLSSAACAGQRWSGARKWRVTSEPLAQRVSCCPPSPHPGGPLPRALCYTGGHGCLGAASASSACLSPCRPPPPRACSVGDGGQLGLVSTVIGSCRCVRLAGSRRAAGE